MLLSKKTKRLLRKISKVDFLSAEDVQNNLDDSIEISLSNKFIDAEVVMYLDTGGSKYSKYWITETGRAYLDYVFNDNFRFWLPICLSTLALAVSILAFFI